MSLASVSASVLLLCVTQFVSVMCQTIRDKSSFNPNDYDHYVRFDSNVPASACVAGNPIDLYWTTFATHIEIMAINVQHNGYVSVGWCEQGTYTPARKEVASRCTYISGAVRASNGQVAAFDQYDKIPTPATGQHATVTPRRDNLYGGTDHNLDFAGAIVGGSLKFKWTRLFDTRESATFSAQSVSHSMDTQIINGAQWMIWAVGPDGFDCINAFNATANSAGSDCSGAIHPGCGWEQFNWFTDHHKGSSPTSSSTTTTTTTTSTTTMTTTSTTTTRTPIPTPRPTPVAPTPSPTPSPTPPPSPGVWLSAVAHWTFDGTYADETRGTVLTPRNNPILSTTSFAVGTGSLSLTNAVELVALDSAKNAVVDVSGDRFNLTDSSNQMSHSVWFRCAPGRCSGILVWTQNGYLRLFEVANGNSTMRFALYAQAGMGNELNSGEAMVKDGEFHHFVAVFDGSTMKIFLDCTSPSCSPLASAAFGPAVLNPAMTANAGNCGVLFGARCQRDTAATGGTNAFRGDIDDYMLFNKALSIDDILRIRARKPAAVAPTPLPTPAPTTTSTATTTTSPSTSTTTSRATPTTTTSASSGSTTSNSNPPTTTQTLSPTPPPTPAPTPVPLNAPCSAYSVACSQCVDSSMHSASTCRFCDNKCSDTADIAATCSIDAFYSVAPDDIAACPRVAPPIRSEWREVVASSNSMADFRLRWRHDESNIEFEVSAKTDGWVGIGWSSAKFSDGANHLTMETFVGSVSDAGVTRVANGYSMFNIVQPATNAKPLVFGLPTVSSVGGRTTLTFVRPIAVPTDAKQNVAIEDRVMYVSWAVGADDIERTPTGEQCRANSVAVDDVFCFKEHVAAGTLPVNFLNPIAEATTTTLVVLPTETSSANLAFVAVGTTTVLASAVAIAIAIALLP